MRRDGGQEEGGRRNLLRGTGRKKSLSFVLKHELEQRGLLLRLFWLLLFLRVRWLLVRVERWGSW